jgi:hypothetical protein
MTFSNVEMNWETDTALHRGHSLRTLPFKYATRSLVPHSEQYRASSTFSGIHITSFFLFLGVIHRHNSSQQFYYYQ